MNFDVLILVAIVAIVPFLLLLLSCALSVPKAVESFQKLRVFHKAANFTEAVGWVTLSFSFLSIVYVTWIRFVIRYESHIESQPFKWVVSLALLFFIFYFLIPNTYSFFKRWRITKKPADFSLSVFFGFLSFVTLSLIYLRVMFFVMGVRGH